MSEAAETTGKKPKMRKPFGRPGLPRLPGLDLRSHHGRAFRRHYRALIAAFPDHPEEAKELAGLRAAIERTTAELVSTSLEHWQVARAREALPPLHRLASKLELKLAATKAKAQSQGNDPSLAEVLARHAPAAPEKPVGAREAPQATAAASNPLAPPSVLSAAPGEVAE